jgi:hypothetical protein
MNYDSAGNPKICAYDPRLPNDPYTFQNQGLRPFIIGAEM